MRVDLEPPGTRARGDAPPAAGSPAVLVAENVSVYTQCTLGCKGVSSTSAVPCANGTSKPLQLTVVSAQPPAGPLVGGCSTDL
jgi:hypothetical protein